MKSDDRDGKVVISVCFGSSCHLKGSFMVTEIIKKFIKEHSLEGSVELKGSLCMGQCANGVNITVNETMFSNLSSDEVNEIETLLSTLLLNAGENHDTK